MFKLIADGWMYIHIPKTSGGNLKKIIIKYYSGQVENVYIKSKAYDYWWNNLALTKNVALLKESYPVLSKHIPLNVYEKVFDCSKLKIFTIVRNP